MNNISDNVKKKMNDRFDNYLQKKSKEIIELREKIDKKLGTYKPNKYKVDITTIQEEVKDDKNNS